MKYELQLQFSLDTTLSFGSTFPSRKLGDWLITVCSRYNGQLQIYHGDVNSPTVFLEFAELDQANDFFKDVHEKLAPRMFYQTETDAGCFLEP